MIISNGLFRVCVAGALLGLSLSATARVQEQQATAEIRRTSFGVPHIRANDERELGFGIGYAYAQDNLCLLANEVVTVNGERARYFGPEQATLEGRNNLANDVFFTWLNTPRPLRHSGRPSPRRFSSALKGMLPVTTTTSRSALPRVCRRSARRPGYGRSWPKTWSS